MNGLRKNFQLIFNIQIKRRFLTNKIIDVIVLLLIISLFFSYIFISKYLQNLASVFHALIPFSEKSFLLILFSSILMLTVMTIFYSIMVPIKRLPKILLIIGAAATCSVWIFLHEMFDVIMNMSQSYGIFYGSMRNLFISLIWLFLNIAGLLFGVELIAFIYNKDVYKYRMLLMQPNRILIENFFNNKIERFKKDEILFNHGSPSAFLYFIVEGQIETIINNQKRVLHNNEYFGELSIINNSKRVGDAKVVSDWAKVIKIPQLAFKKLLKEDISFQNDILKNLNKIIIN